MLAMRAATMPRWLSVRCRRCRWGQNPDKIEAVIKDHPEVLALWREAMVGKQGAHADNVSMKDAGNSRAYTVSRLKRESPGLFQQVVAGEQVAASASRIHAMSFERIGWQSVPETTKPASQ